MRRQPDAITESNENNNDCNNGTADTVQVVEELAVEQDPLQVTKTGKGSYVESHSWNVTKALDDDDKANKSAAAGETVTFAFNIEVERSPLLRTSLPAARSPLPIPRATPRTPSSPASRMMSQALPSPAAMAPVPLTATTGNSTPPLSSRPAAPCPVTGSMSRTRREIPPSDFQNTATAHVLSGSPVEGVSGTHDVTFSGGT
ncbi:MAG: hypothetical protein U5Q44_11700 [Dehalococcoidia bacterium]|nr:hypothetical protein [Dehalococcoidia bacterium]